MFSSLSDLGINPNNLSRFYGIKLTSQSPAFYNGKYTKGILMRDLGFQYGFKYKLKKHSLEIDYILNLLNTYPSSFLKENLFRFVLFSIGGIFKTTYGDPSSFMMPVNQVTLGLKFN
jgi:hypothetical protein